MYNFTKNTFIHKLHPIVKIIIVALTTLLVLINPGLEGGLEIYVIWLFVLSCFWIVAKINLRESSRIIKIGIVIAFILIITQGFFYRYSESFTPLFTIGNIDIAGKGIGTFTLEGLIAGLVGSLKIFCIMFSVPILVATTRIEDFAYSLNKLGVPYKFAFVLLTGMRFVPLVEQTWSELINAQKLRGYDVDRLGIIKKVRDVYNPSIVSLIVILFKAGLNLQIAIDTRGFDAPIKRTEYYTLKINIWDCLVITALIAIFFLEIYFFMF
jgi:energy-coupling factor transport system permease protein